LRLAVVFALAVFAFAGCGGDGDDADSVPTNGTTAQGTTSGPAGTTTSDDHGGGGGGRQRDRPDDPRTAVEAVLVSSDPAKACAKYVTPHFLSVAYGGRLGCVQAQASAAAANQLDFESVRVDGDRARALVVPSGGPYDGERVTVSLVRDGHRWAVDELEANVPVGP
jgi:hypothetical protein